MTTTPVPAPGPERVPTVRKAGCRYCERYGRACGRHDDLMTETVYIEITHRVPVTVDRDGWEFRGKSGDAAALVADAIARREWGGYSALGQALKGLQPWEAFDIRMAAEQSPAVTTSEAMLSDGQAQR